jgi:hypothetical protein
LAEGWRKGVGLGSLLDANKSLEVDVLLLRTIYSTVPGREEEVEELQEELLEEYSNMAKNKKRGVIGSHHK